MRPAHLFTRLAALVCLTAALSSVSSASAADLGARVIPLRPAGAGRPGFVRQSAPVTGLAFTNRLSEVLALNNQILENGAGVALGDFDGDGRCDVYLCGAETDNRLFRNLGDWKFADVTSEAGVACAGQFSTGAVFADVDGDRDLDLLVNGLGVGTRLFLNDGAGKFQETARSGLLRRGAATSMALADLDGDGDLDLYVCFYRSTSARGDTRPPPVSTRMVNGELVVTPEDQFFGILRADGTIELVEKGEPDVLYWNDGRGRFTAASWTNGAFLNERGEPLPRPPEDWSLSVMLRDFNGDGWPDIYVCNDFFRSRDQLWLSDGRGRFRAASATALRGFPLSSMAVDLADINRDGFDDVFIAEMLSRDHRTRRRQRANAPHAAQNVPVTDPTYALEHPRNVMLLARGDGTFADIAWLSGLAATDWTWNAAFLDVDLDGWEDLLVATGNAHDVLDLDAQDAIDRAGPNRTQPTLAFYPPLALPNLAFRNHRDLTFSEVGPEWGFDAPGISQGLALGDLDNDGDLDVVLNNLNQEAWLYRNDGSAPRVAVRLRGGQGNTQGIGARVQVTAGDGLPVQSQVIVAGGRYLGGDEALRTFATGAARALGIEVGWPSGKVSRIEQAAPGNLYEIDEAVAAPADRVASPVPESALWFANVSAALGHQHHDNTFDEWARQPLLPRQLGTGGPGVSWFDVNDDGWDDLIVGAGKGGRLAVLVNNTRGGFDSLPSPILTSLVTRDVTTTLGWSPTAGKPRLLSGSTNYEDGTTNGASVLEWDLASGIIRDVRAAPALTSGPLALADLDSDGDLDLFVGGRVTPGRWPEPASSLILRNDHDEWRPDEPNSRLLDRVGMASGAVFTDLDSDGDPDLALACEWGSPKIFRNQGGLLSAWDPMTSWPDPSSRVAPERTQRLSALVGLWTSVTAGDFDGDGQPDLIFGNWGRNCRDHAFLEGQLWFGDLGEEGRLEFIEAIFDPALQKVVPWRSRDAFASSMPWLVERYPTLRSFANAGVAELLQNRVSAATRLTLATTDSVILLNRGDHFVGAPLPWEAQVAPAFGLAVADFNGDGREDLFLAQNFFGAELETSRLDAGRGLILQGNGRGGFAAVPGQISGVMIYGEQRGAAVADFNRDGRPDLAVGQNSGPTQLFLNRAGRPGLRIRLSGPPGNPKAVGASVRVRSADGWGAAREIRAGAGYWSQDSPTAVVAAPDSASEIEVRWPGGKTTVAPLTPGNREVEVVLGP